MYYESINSWVDAGTPLNSLILGDCIEGMNFLSDKSIDLIVTDPPYGLNYQNGDLTNSAHKIFGHQRKQSSQKPVEGDDKNSLILFENFLKQAKRLLKKGACCCCCGGGGGPEALFAKWSLLIDKYIGFKQAVVWDKGWMGMGFHYRRSYEFILISQNGDPIHRWNGGFVTSNVWYLPKIIPRSDQHPTEKPVGLMRRSILLHSDKDDIILDPFAGRSSTIIAAIEENRKWIGFEIDKKWYDLSKKRIQIHLKRPETIFPGELLLKQKQEKL